MTTAVASQAASAAELTVLDAIDGRWRALADAAPGASAFHHPAWSALLAETYGFRSFVLALPGEDGRLEAGLPVIEVGRRRGGRRWVSLPFTDYVPPLARSEDARARFAAALAVARREAGVSALEVRAGLAAPGAHGSVAAVRHELSLAGGADAVFRGFKKGVRQRLTKVDERGNLVVERDDSPAALLDVFYRLHVQTRRRLGMPVQPRNYFALLHERMFEPGLGFVVTVRADDRAVAAAVFLGWQGTLTYKYSASDPDYWRLSPNNLLLWSAMRWGCENGFQSFDFGRSDLENEGLRAFKRGWGSVESPLEYTTFADEAPRKGGGAAMRVAAAVIKRSPPLVCRGLGEVFYRFAA